MDPHWLSATLSAARPRVVAALFRYFRDLDEAEDCFQEASLRALRVWGERGVPDDGISWLIKVGRNIGLDRYRKQSRYVASDETEPVASDPEDEYVAQMDAQDYRDDMLRLLFTCCHPTLPKPQQVALALKVIAGLRVEEIAKAFLVRVKTMEQRITRAKRALGQARISHDPPSPAERDERLKAVSTAIYLLFNEGYSAAAGEAHIRVSICEEAIRLARLLLRLFPTEAEIMGLLSLCLIQHSRHRARLDASGDIVLLEHQDRGRWDRGLIAEGSVLLEKALRIRQPGPFQIQAAIASVHAQARTAEQTDWAEIVRLYALLERAHPSPVVALNRAVAVAKVEGAAAALALLEPLEGKLSGYFHYHGVRGALLAELERPEEALAAFRLALTHSGTAAETTHIRQKIEELGVRPVIPPSA